MALGIMKSELLYAKKYTSMDSFITDLKEYMVYYNNERIKLRLNGMSPVLYRKHSNRLTVINPSNFLGSLQYVDSF